MSDRVVHDALDRPIRLPLRPQRIVSLVPSLTEWLFAVGAADQIVGITEFCVHPAAGVATKIKLRGTKNPDRAAIVALQPDLVIAAKEENRQRDVEALAVAGVPVYVSDPRSVASAIHTLATLADLIGATACAAPLLAEMRAAVDQLSADPPATRPRVLALIWREPWMAVGADTYAHDLLTLCGMDNVAAVLPDRYPRLEAPTIAALEPELVLLPSEPYRFTDADLPALRGIYRGAVQFVDGELLTWYGPRITQAVRRLKFKGGVVRVQPGTVDLKRGT